MRSIFAIAVSLTACGHDVVLVDEGRACVDDLAVVITSPCVSACAENVSAGCDVDARGGEITVRSHFAYDEPAGACIALCGSLKARCALPRLAPGRYTLRHGDDTRQLEVPGAGDQCLGER